MRRPTCSWPERWRWREIHRAPWKRIAPRSGWCLPPPMCINRLGHLLAAEGDWSGAAQAWQHTVDLVPDYAYAYVHLGDAFEHLDRRDEALSAYEQALALCGRFAEGLEKMGRKEQAAIFCREVRSSVVRLQGQ